MACIQNVIDRSMATFLTSSFFQARKVTVPQDTQPFLQLEDFTNAISGSRAHRAQVRDEHKGAVGTPT